jgi:hypothetical protein
VFVETVDGTRVFDASLSVVLGGGTSHDVALPSLRPGIYRLVHYVFDRSQTFRYYVPGDLAFVQLGEHVNSAVMPGKHVYFYVPPGLTRVVLNIETSAAIHFYDPTGAAVTPTRNGPNLYVLDVPHGQDGAAWSFSDHKATGRGGILLVNLPNVFAFSDRHLLVQQSYTLP